MTYQRLEIFFNDETNKIGCGLRQIECVIGWKWVKIKLRNGRHARLRRSIFEDMKARTARHKGVAA